MPIDELLCGCDYEADFSAPEGCESECGDCVDECGVEDCSVVVCRNKVDVSSISDCDSTVPESGQMDNFALATDATGVRFFSKAGTMQPITTETLDQETRQCTIDEKVTGQGRTGNAELCWMRDRKGQEVLHFILDSCNRLRVYGHNGGYELINFEETPGGGGSDTCGITYTFSNVKKTGFVFVDYVAMGFPTATDFLNDLLP